MARRILAGVLVSCLSGCSFVGPRQQTLTVSSDPPGALVLVDGRPVGNTPLDTSVSRSKDVLLELRLDGYQTEFRSSVRVLSSFGIADVVGGWAIYVPFLGLLSPAAWEHDPSVFGISMTPVSPTAATEPSPP